jgi:glycosyltransferase involved in cell wall biosynthesis
MEKDKKSIEVLNEKLAGKKILQLGNLAGWPFTVAKGLRELGVESENILHEYRDVRGIDRKLPYDGSIFDKGDNVFLKAMKTIAFLLSAPKKYQIIHYHSSNILPRGLLFIEAFYLRFYGVKTVVSFGGGDARLLKEANEKNKHFYRKSGFFRDLVVRIRWLNWNRFVDACATDPEMLATKMNKIKNRVLFMQPIDFSRLNITSEVECVKPVKIMHVPTESEVKGTSIFMEVIEQLSNKHEVEFTHKRNLPQDEFYKLLSSTDVYLDELKCGSYGVTAAEAMALGKVVVTYVREDLVGKYPVGFPIYNANPENIYERLDELLGDLSEINRIKCESYNYASQNHDSRKILTNTIIPLYTKLINES